MDVWLQAPAPLVLLSLHSWSTADLDADDVLDGMPEARQARLRADSVKVLIAQEVDDALSSWRLINFLGRYLDLPRSHAPQASKSGVLAATLFAVDAIIAATLPASVLGKG